MGRLYSIAKGFGELFARILKYISNLSLCSGVFPSWKKPVVVSILKGVTNQWASNFFTLGFPKCCEIDFRHNNFVLFSKLMSNGQVDAIYFDVWHWRHRSLVQSSLHKCPRPSLLPFLASWSVAIHVGTCLMCRRSMESISPKPSCTSGLADCILSVGQSVSSVLLTD